MVPIRFIAESFNCQVDYAKNLVNIKTAPLVIENKQVAKMTRTSETNEYNYFYELKANLFVKNMYQTIFNQHGQEVDEPEYFGVHMNLDRLVYYWNANDDYTLLDANDKVIGKFVIYVITGNGLPRPKEYPKYLLYDDLTKKWYSLPEATYAHMQRWNWTATRYSAPGYDTAWQLAKKYDKLLNKFISTQ
jgi:hypothetical protein